MNTFDTEAFPSEMLALEAEITALTEVRTKMSAAGGFDTRIALEADAITGGSDLARLVFSSTPKAQKQEIALEGIASKIWEKIKEFFGKLKSWIKTFINWLRGRNSDGLTPEEVKKAEQEAEATEREVREKERVAHQEAQHRNFVEHANEGLSKFLASMSRHDGLLLGNDDTYRKGLAAIARRMLAYRKLEEIQLGIAKARAWLDDELSKADDWEKSAATSGSYAGGPGDFFKRLDFMEEFEDRRNTLHHALDGYGFGYGYKWLFDELANKTENIHPAIDVSSPLALLVRARGNLSLLPFAELAKQLQAVPDAMGRLQKEIEAAEGMISKKFEYTNQDPNFARARDVAMSSFLSQFQLLLRILVDYKRTLEVFEKLFMECRRLLTAVAKVCLRIYEGASETGPGVSEADQRVMEKLRQANA